MTTYILRKSTLALILLLLTAGGGKAFAQSVAPFHPSKMTPSDSGGGLPDPTGGSGGTLVAVHLV